MKRITIAFFGVTATSLGSLVATMIPQLGIHAGGTILPAAGVAGAAGMSAVLLLKRKRISFLLGVKGRQISSDSALSALLGIEWIEARGNTILAKARGSEKIVAHCYVKISQPPYLVEDLDINKKLYFLQSFTRFLASQDPTFEIIARLSKINADIYTKSIYKQIEDLRLSQSFEGQEGSPAAEYRLKYLERLAKRLSEGEGARDCYWLMHVMAEDKDKEEAVREVSANTKSLISSLEVSLGVKGKWLKDEESVRAMREFFRGSCIVRPRNSQPTLVWELAYFAPITRLGLPAADKILSGVYLGNSGSTPIFIDLQKYMGPHVLISGVTGSGKTYSLAVLLIRHHLQFGAKILILDATGQHAKWVRTHGGKVVDLRNVGINPFELGPETLTAKIQQTVDAFNVICEFDSINQRNAFAECITRAYKSNGFKIDDPTTWNNKAPTLLDIIDLLRADVSHASGVTKGTIESLLRRLDMMTGGAFGIFAKSTISFGDLIEGFTCLDLSGIASQRLQSLLSWSALQYLDSVMRIEGPRNKIELIVALEEIWKVGNEETGIPVKLAKEARKYGWALFSTVQDPLRDVAEPVLTNAGTIILHRTDNPRYLQYWKKRFELTDNEISRLRHLPAGEALVKISLDERPFFVKVDAEELQNDSNLILQNEQENIQPTLEKADSNRGDQAAYSDQMEEMVMGSISNKVMPITELLQELKLNKYQLSKIQGSLVKKGKVKIIRLPTLELKGRRPIALVSAEAVAQAGRKGGIAHRYAIDLLADKLQKLGKIVQKEFPIENGRAIDLVVDGEIAIEIETGKSDIVSNIKKLQDSSFSRKIIVCIDKSLKEELSKQNFVGIEIIRFSQTVQAIQESVSSPAGRPISTSIVTNKPNDVVPAK